VRKHHKHTKQEEPRQGVHFGLRIPRDPHYPEDCSQCDDCGGTGFGEGVMTSQPKDCETCHGRGWLEGKLHPKGRRCAYEECNKPLFVSSVAVYCTNECAFADA
jgi:hypothetical protein